MGVPGYFSYARRVCPYSVKKAGDGLIPRFDVLYVDFNSMVHNAVPRSDEAVSDERVIKTTVDMLQQVAADVGAPRVVVCADGVPPEAKMVQQRNRRFMSTKRDAMLGRSGGFDRNVITPGTKFMDMLNYMVPALLRRSEDGREYEYSGSDEPGEGEQKIMAAIRSGQDRGAKSVDCVYGLDADLVLLCASLRAQGRASPWLCREEQDGALSYVDSDMLTKHVSGGKLWNHVLCSFLCGNDFLPPLSCLDVKRDMGRMRKICHERGLDMVAGEEINWADVGRLLDALSAEEDRDFARADREYWSCSVPPIIRDEDKWDYYPLIHKDESHRYIRPGEANWRNRYYVSLFGMRSETGVERVTGEFIRGVRWTFDYYRGAFGTETPAWSYGHAYGPTALDLYNAVCVCDTPPSSDISGLPREEVTPEQLLLFVTPNGSRASVFGRRVDRRPEWLFPDDWKVSTYLHKRVWHCKANLPCGKPLDVAIVPPRN